MADVYISCAPKNTAAAKHIQKNLKEKGISSFICTDALPSGGSSENAAPAELLSAVCFVVLVSKHSLSSAIVKNELYWASRENRIILPMLLDDALPNDTFHFYLGTKQWIMAKRRFSAASKELCDVIWAELHGIPQKTKNDTEDKAQMMRKDKKEICIRTGLVVLILVAYLIANTVSFNELREENLDLSWKIDNILSLVMIVAIFLVTAPLFGGYKVFLRTVLEKLRDAFRGEKHK